MSSISPSFAVVIGSLVLPLTGAAQTIVVDFAEISLSSESYYQSGSSGEQVTFHTQGVELPHTTPTWGGFSDFTVSNTTDTTTAGNLNASSAYPGSGKGDANYGVGYVLGSLSLSFTQSGGVSPQEISLTNTTYAALSMLQGDTFAKPFGGPNGDDEDFFLLTITGRDALAQETGSVDFYLADYRFADESLDYIVDEWSAVDLSIMGAGVTQLDFVLTSSDVGSFGMNTPAYFAFDNLTYSAVPEPQTVGLMTGVAILGLIIRRRRGLSR